MKTANEVALEIYRGQVNIYGGVNSDKEDRKCKKASIYVVNAIIGALTGLGEIHSFHEDFTAQDEVCNQIVFWKNVIREFETF